MEHLPDIKDALSPRGVVMPTKPTAQRVYPDEHGQSVIICPQCMSHTPIDAKPYMDSHKALKVGCRCGHKFPVVFDARRFYRKALHLPGQYTKLPTDDPELVTIEDLSYTGARFRTRASHKIEVDEVLTIDFELDNWQRSHIVKTVRVMYVLGRVIGADFCDRQAHSTELIYYLNPIWPLWRPVVRLFGQVFRKNPRPSAVCDGTDPPPAEGGDRACSGHIGTQR